MRRDDDIEQNVMRTMESIDTVGKAVLPSHLEKDFMARLDRVQREDRSRTKWFWAAAVVLFIINATVAYNYASMKSESESVTASGNSTAPARTTFTNFYYGNSSSLYQ